MPSYTTWAHALSASIRSGSETCSHKIHSAITPWVSWYKSPAQKYLGRIRVNKAPNGLAVSKIFTNFTSQLLSQKQFLSDRQIFWCRHVAQVTTRSTSHHPSRLVSWNQTYGFLKIWRKFVIVSFVACSLCLLSEVLLSGYLHLDIWVSVLPRFFLGSPYPFASDFLPADCFSIKIKVEFHCDLF